MLNLYELTQQYLNVLNYSDDPEFDDQYIKDTLETIDFEIHDKADGYVRLIKTLEGEVLMLDKYIKENTAKKVKKENLIKYLKNNLLDCMVQLDEKEIKTKFANVKVVGNGGLQPLKCDEEKVPIDYMIRNEVWTVDKEKIRKELEAGKQLPFAELTERGNHLAIK